MSNHDQEPEEDALAEGGGSGGGTESVRYERDRISPARTVFGVIFIIIAVAIIILPLLWPGAKASLGPLNWIRVSTLIILAAAAAAFGWALLRKST